jgi:hypothetical protein
MAADKGIKQTRILKSELPPVSSNNTYTVRYRVISEDKNRTSHYSEFKNVANPTITTVSGTLVKNGTFSIGVWDDVSNYPSYDIFVKFDGGSYSYHGTTPTHTYSFLNTGTTSVQMAVQISSTSKTRNTLLQVFESSSVSLV